MTKTKKQTGAADAAPPVERSPDRVQFDALRVEKDKLAARSAPLREQRDAIGNEIRALEKKEESLRQRIEAIEHPRLPEIDRELSQLARRMGGRRMNG